MLNLVYKLKHSKLLFSIAIACISTNFCSNLTLAQSNPYIRDGSIGSPRTDKQNCIKSNKPFTFIPFDCWVGEKIIFLPRNKSTQRYGYQFFDCDSLFGSTVPYQEAVGQIGTIQKIQKEEYSTKIVIEMDNGKIYCGRSISDSLMSISFLRDIEDARRIYTNRTLWYSKNQIVGYDSENDSFFSTDVKKYSPVKVIDVVAGWYESEPVRFIIRNQSGIEGYVDVNMSGTNTSRLLSSLSRFEKKFFEQDPRELFNWSPTIWQAIESGNILVGMTWKQVVMSWGDPYTINKNTNINTSTEQWVYKNRGYLYFENGVLQSIQN